MGLLDSLTNIFTPPSSTQPTQNKEVVGNSEQNIPQYSYEECKEIYARFSLGKRFVKSIVRFSMKSNRVISIEDAPEEVARQYENYFLKKRINQIIKNTVYLSRVYGMSGIYVGVEGKEGEQKGNKLTLEEKKSSRLYFNTIDPLGMRYLISQDKTSSDFLKPSNIELEGIAIHPSRFFSVLNGDPIYLYYSDSSFNYGGLSIFSNMRRFIEIWTSLFSSLETLAVKAGGIVVENDTNGIESAKDAEVARYSANLIKEMKNGGVAWLNQGQHANFFNLNGATEIASMIGEAKHALSIALDDTPTSILFDDKLSSGLNEGGADLEKMTMLIDSFREDVLRPLFEFFDNILPYQAWSDDFILSIKTKHGDKYGTMGIDEIREKWIKDLSYSFADTNAKTKLQTEEAKGIQLDNIIKLKSLGATQETLQALINAQGIFDKQIELDNPMDSDIWQIEDGEVGENE